MTRKHRTRIYLSAAQRADIWDRWQRSESMSSIGRLFERESSSIYPILAPSGGIRPSTRTRARRALNLSEREEISRGVASQQSESGSSQIFKNTVLTHNHPQKNFSLTGQLTVAQLFWPLFFLTHEHLFPSLKCATL